MYSIFIVFVAAIRTVILAKNPTQLCADEKCSFPLYEAKALRDTSRPDLVPLKPDDKILIYAIHLSNAVDMIVGENVVNEQRGLVYRNHLDPDPYDAFVINAVHNNEALFEVVQGSQSDLPRNQQVRPKKVAAREKLGVEATKIIDTREKQGLPAIVIRNTQKSLNNVPPPQEELKSKEPNISTIRLEFDNIVTKNGGLNVNAMKEIDAFANSIKDPTLKSSLLPIVTEYRMRYERGQKEKPSKVVEQTKNTIPAQHNTLPGKPTNQQKEAVQGPKIVLKSASNLKPEGAAQVDPTPAAKLKPEGAAQVDPTPATNIQPKMAAQVDSTPAANIQPKISEQVDSDTATNIQPKMAAEVYPPPPTNIQVKVAAEVDPTPTVNVQPKMAAQVDPTPTANIQPKMAAQVDSKPGPNIQPDTAAQVDSTVVDETVEENVVSLQTGKYVEESQPNNSDQNAQLKEHVKEQPPTTTQHAPVTTDTKQADSGDQSIINKEESNEIEQAIEKEEFVESELTNEDEEVETKEQNKSVETEPAIVEEQQSPPPTETEEILINTEEETKPTSVSEQEQLGENTKPRRKVRLGAVLSHSHSHGHSHDHDHENSPHEHSHEHEDDNESSPHGHSHTHDHDNENSPHGHSHGHDNENSSHEIHEHENSNDAGVGDNIANLDASATTTVSSIEQHQTLTLIAEENAHHHTDHSGENDVVPQDPHHHPPGMTHEVHDQLGQDYCIDGDCYINDDEQKASNKEGTYQKRQMDNENDHDTMTPEEIALAAMNKDKQPMVVSLRATLAPVTGIMRSALNQIRRIMPTSIGIVLADFDDAGLILLLFAPLVFIFYLSAACFSTNNDHRVAITNSQYATLAQRYAALETENQKMRKILHETGANEQSVAVRENDLAKVKGDYQAQLDQAMHRLKESNKENERLENELDHYKQTLQEKTAQAKVAIDTEEKLRAQYNEMHTHLQTVEEELTTRRAETKCLTEKSVELEQQVTHLLKESKDFERQITLLSAQLKETEVAKTVLHDENKMLHCKWEEAQLQVTGLQDIITTLQQEHELDVKNRQQAPSMNAIDKNDSNDGSGWSEMDDWNDTMDDYARSNNKKASKEEHQKKPHRLSHSPTELFNVAKLRANISNLEAELKSARHELDTAEKFKERIEKENTELTNKLADLHKKANELADEKSDIWAQTKRLTKMLEDTSAKLEERENLLEKSRSTTTQQDDEVRKLRESVIKWEERCKEANKDIQRLKRDIEKQEARHFHELRTWKTEQEQQEAENSRLRQQLISQTTYTTPTYNYGLGSVMNRPDSGGGNSSDAELSFVFQQQHTSPTMMRQPINLSGGYSSLATADPAQLFPEGPHRRPKSTSTNSVRPRSRGHRRSDNPDDFNTSNYTSSICGDSERRSTSHQAKDDHERQIYEQRRAQRRQKQSSKGRMSAPTMEEPGLLDSFNKLRSIRPDAQDYYSSPDEANSSSPPEMALISGVPPTGVLVPKSRKR